MKGENQPERIQRKINRLQAYDYDTAGAYFVTVCTQDRKQILSNIVGDGFPVLKMCGQITEKLIWEIPGKYPGVTVERYVIMPDHIHLLICIPGQFGTGNPSPTLGNIIGWFKYQVTKQINMAWQTQGKRIFQRSYYDHVIRNQQDYDEIWKYIEDNPAKWTEKHRNMK